MRYIYSNDNQRYFDVAVKTGVIKSSVVIIKVFLKIINNEGWFYYAFDQKRIR